MALGILDLCVFWAWWRKGGTPESQAEHILKCVSLWSLLSGQQGGRFQGRMPLQYWQTVESFTSPERWRISKSYGLLKVSSSVVSTVGAWVVFKSGFEPNFFEVFLCSQWMCFSFEIALLAQLMVTKVKPSYLAERHTRLQ